MIVMNSPSPFRASAKAVVCFGVFACLMVVLSGLAVYNLGADLDWDLLNYHFYNGYLWVHGLLIKDSLASVQSYLEPELNAFYYSLISTRTPLQVNLILAALQSLSISAVWVLGFFLLSDLAFARRLFFASLTAGLGLIGPAFWSELGSTMGDSLLAGLVIIALVLAVEGQVRKNNLLFFISGLFIGAASALKFTNMVFAFGIGGSVLLTCWYQGRFKRFFIQDVLLGIGFILAFGAIYSSTGMLLFHTYKSPFFPYFNNIFHSPYMAPVSWHDGRWLPQNVQGFLTLPFRLAVPLPQWQSLDGVNLGMEIPFRTLYPSLIAVIAPLFIIGCFLRKRNSISACIENEGPTNRLFFVFSFMFISLIVWEKMFSYYRYFIPLEILSPCVFGVFFAGYLPWRRLKAFSLLLASLGIIGFSVYSLPLPQWRRIPYSSSYFGISKADFSAYQNALIISPDYPMGYVLPFFPSSDRMMGVPEKLGLGLTPVFYKTYLEPLKTFDKIFVVFDRSNSNLESDQEVLKKTFNLIVDSKNCKSYTTHAGNISVCPAHKAPVPLTPSASQVTK